MLHPSVAFPSGYPFFFVLFVPFVFNLFTPRYESVPQIAFADQLEPFANHDLGGQRRFVHVQR